MTLPTPPGSLPGSRSPNTPPPTGPAATGLPPSTDHRWSGCPGLYCLNCGNDSPLESAMCCGDCFIHCGPEDEGKPEKWCEFHAAWGEAIQGCPPDPAKIKAFKNRYPDMRPEITL